MINPTPKQEKERRVLWADNRKIEAVHTDETDAPWYNEFERHNINSNL